MNRTETEKTYLRAAVQNATAVGLVIILFDMLIGDLKQVIAAIDEGNIEKRSTELKHAFLVLQQLEGSLDMESGGEAAKSFSRFYSAIRSKLLEAHIKISPEIFRRQIELLLDVRQAWQTIDKPDQGSTSPGPALSVTARPVVASNGDDQVMRTSWTA
jgi:flagellar protein FliS